VSEKAGRIEKVGASDAGAKMPPRPGPIPEALQALGPMSVGHPHEGFLVNGERLPNSDDWVLTLPSHGWHARNQRRAHALHRQKERARAGTQDLSNLAHGRGSRYPARGAPLRVRGSDEPG
jgi:hypothetical protein